MKPFDNSKDKLKQTDFGVAQIKNDSEFVQIEKSELAQLKKDIQALKGEVQRADEVWFEKDNKEPVLIATIRADSNEKGEEVYVIDYRQKPVPYGENTRTNMLFIVTWLQPDGTTIENDIHLQQLVKKRRVEVKLVKKYVKNLEKIVGYTRRVEVDYDRYRSFAKDIVPMIVTADEISFDVELPDGRIIRLSETRINQ